METPAIVVNVKTYKEGTGRKGLKIAKIMEKVSEETGASMVIAVQTPDIYMIASEVKIPVFAQHMDAINCGSHTGWTLPESIKEAGARGVLLNHSEHPLKIGEIAKGVERARELQLETIVCANNIGVTGAVATLSPDFVAIEPPELIGGDISVTKAEPEIIKKAVGIVKKINPSTKVLCGAGVKRGKDVKKAIDLGTEGVLLASGVVKTGDKEKVLREMASAIEKK
ncbi:MAG: triose-phosphate isomerase [Candidatus Thermoplasmatota archaeon]|nr:triose-phosphate isomerase [Candidatus Thermoplasmatota archaeon]